ncbi:coiled-coil-helix-coiled-coil-helix domain containing 6b isoform X3 [Brachyhypopomus gauderio]|uniref:coiled-coil-helix-coiled-coil-helix domain containing 6b isoform X3 n=1 Tax=Brachyhypopomus gauderio TaxID=698409 RepID=UPI004042741A
MGGKESTTRKVSYGLDEEENVTVLQGMKLSSEVLQRMREPGPSGRPPSPKADSPKPPPGPIPASMAEMQEELRKRYEEDQALLRDELARIARREKEAGGDTQTSTALHPERDSTSEELKKVQNLARQLARKDAELRHLAAFYKEQLQLMEKKNMDYYQQTSQMYSRAAAQAEASVEPKHTVPICPDLQSQVLNCYKENRHKTLHCSALAKEYMNCINSAKKNVTVNRGS